MIADDRPASPQPRNKTVEGETSPASLASTPTATCKHSWVKWERMSWSISDREIQWRSRIRPSPSSTRIKTTSWS